MTSGTLRKWIEGIIISFKWISRCIPWGRRPCTCQTGGTVLITTIFLKDSVDEPTDRKLIGVSEGKSVCNSSSLLIFF